MITRPRDSEGEGGRGHGPVCVCPGGRDGGAEEEGSDQTDEQSSGQSLVSKVASHGTSGIGKRTVGVRARRPSCPSEEPLHWETPGALRGCPGNRTLTNHFSDYMTHGTEVLSNTNCKLSPPQHKRCKDFIFQAQ